MLKIMELLRQIDMITQLQLLRDMPHVKNDSGQSETPPSQGSARKTEAK